jgi:energy-coupling factor transport system permease protein
MTLFLYLDQETFIHRLDPRTKLISAFLLWVLCLTFNHPLYLAAISSGVFLVAVRSGSLSNFWKLRVILALLFFFSTLLWPFFVPGPTRWWAWGPFLLSRESFLYGIAMGLRLTTFVYIGLIFLSTTRNEELTSGLIRMGLPYPMAFALSTALRLVPTFVGAGATIIQAQVSRGLDLETGNLFRRLSKFIPQAVPLFIYAFNQTNYLAMALESKGFDPGSKRTFYYELRMKPIDYLVLGFLGLVTAVLLYGRLGRSWGVLLPGRL